MDCIKLMTAAAAKIQANDLPFIEKTRIALSFLRSKGVLPIRRASINGDLHIKYSAMLVEAFEQGTTVDIPTRRQADLYQRGLTTKIIHWFDSSVEHDVLVPMNGASYAKGSLHLGSLFKKLMN